MPYCPRQPPRFVTFFLTPPDGNPRDVLKATLIERVFLSKRCKIHQFLHAEQLGDRKPSQLLRRLQQLSGNSESDLRELFLQRLPSHVQVGLLSHPGKPLAELASERFSKHDATLKTTWT